jgi:hypothetical protein
MAAQRWRVATLVLLLAFVSLFLYTLFGVKDGQNIAPETVVLQVQKLRQLVTVHYRIQRVVGMTEAKDPVGEDSILLMVEGDVFAGVNLAELKASDVATDADGNVTVSLPAPAIVNTSIDEKKTKVWDRHVTWWTPWLSPDPNLEHKARLKAVEDIRQASLDMGILEQAKNNAQSAVRDLFAAVGWKATIHVKGLD